MSRAPTPADVRLAFSVALLLGDAIAEHRRLLRDYEERGTSPELRAASIDLARRIAAYSRLGFLTGEGVLALSRELSPAAALAALGRLCYSLVALAEEHPDSRTLLSDAELDGILRERDLLAWRDHVVSQIPDRFAPL